MSHDPTSPESARRPNQRQAARFWLPFAAMTLLFTALAVAYASDDDSDPVAPGAIKRGQQGADAPTHGLEPAPAH